jgi:tetratricopeptide (TPR) repeat protein
MYYRLVVASLSLFLATSFLSNSVVAQNRGGRRLDAPSLSSVPHVDPLGDSGASARISGTVRSYDGHALENANIEARDVEGRNRFISARSDSDGSFALYNISPGNYDVTVTNGVDEANQRVRVSSSGEVTVDFRLANGSSGDGHKAGNGSTVSLSRYNVPAKARSLYEKAVHLRTQGKLDQSRDKVNAALAICPKFSEALTLRGTLQVAAGRKDEAVADYQQAIQYDASYPLAYLALASLLNSTGRFNESLPLLGQAERLAPGAWQTYFELARANFGKGDFALALHNVARASELQGGPQKESPELHLIRGYTLVGLSQIPLAIQELEAFLVREPSGRSADNARKVLNQLREQSVTASR